MWRYIWWRWHQCVSPVSTCWSKYVSADCLYSYECSYNVLWLRSWHRMQCGSYIFCSSGRKFIMVPFSIQVARNSNYNTTIVKGDMWVTVFCSESCQIITALNSCCFSGRNVWMLYFFPSYETPKTLPATTLLLFGPVTLLRGDICLLFDEWRIYLAVKTVNTISPGFSIHTYVVSPLLWLWGGSELERNCPHL